MVRHRTTGGLYQHHNTPELTTTTKRRTDVADLHAVFCHAEQGYKQARAADGSRVMGRGERSGMKGIIGVLLVYTPPPWGLRGGLGQSGP